MPGEEQVVPEQQDDFFNSSIYARDTDGGVHDASFDEGMDGVDGVAEGVVAGGGAVDAADGPAASLAVPIL